MGGISARPHPPHQAHLKDESSTPRLEVKEIERLHRYLFVRHLCEGKDVIDLASGEGSGSALLAQVARSVVGVEANADAVAHAASAYHRANLRFIQGKACALGLADALADVVISPDTIEHTVDHHTFLAEIRRILKPGGGLLIVSTPDRGSYPPFETPANPSHVREPREAGFPALLGGHFQHVYLFHQRAMIGSVILRVAQAEKQSPPITFEKRGNHLESAVGLPRPQYIVALASDEPVQALPASIFIETSCADNSAISEAGNQAAEVERLRAALYQAVAAQVSADARILELQRALDAAEASAMALERACETAEQAGLAARRQLAECRKRALHNEEHIAAILSSTSWRITGPLRRVLGSLRRGRV
jgi:SAM-dependent methyltransferase